MSEFSSDLFAGRVVLVTGASRGIGSAIADAFAHCGATVVGTALSSESADKVTARLSAISQDSIGIVLNVNDREGCEKAIADLVSRFGHVDVLVNNAGITRDMLAMRLGDADWDAVIDTNLSAAFRLTRALLKPMMRARFGRVINISSIVGSIGNAGQANYSAAKAGLEAMSRTVAREVASRNITVNCVAPGFIDTDMTKGLPEEHKAALLAQVPAKRLGSVDDIARAVLFLASPDAGYVTGTVVHVNGGMYMG